VKYIDTRDSTLTMPIRCNVKVLLAQRNLERARLGERAVSVRQLAETTGIAESALLRLLNNKTSRIDYTTIDKLMAFFGTDDLNDILVRVREGQSDATPIQ
jgi:DNA-binding Xre family transcriptional regulator